MFFTWLIQTVWPSIWIGNRFYWFKNRFTFETKSHGLIYLHFSYHKHRPNIFNGHGHQATFRFCAGFEKRPINSLSLLHLHSIDYAQLWTAQNFVIFSNDLLWIPLFSWLNTSMHKLIGKNELFKSDLSNCVTNNLLTSTKSPCPFAFYSYFSEKVNISVQVPTSDHWISGKHRTTFGDNYSPNILN